MYTNMLHMFTSVYILRCNYLNACYTKYELVAMSPALMHCPTDHSMMGPLDYLQPPAPAARNLAPTIHQSFT